MKLEDIRKVGVAGGGTMGFGIAVNFALVGYPVVVYDLNDQILQKTSKEVQKALKIFVDEGLISQNLANNTFKCFTYSSDMARVADTDFITETIVERLSDKQELFDKLDKICPPQTIIATNTSSLLLSDIAKGVNRQDKVVLTHYFSPPHFVPGVEVAKGPGTSDETYDIAYELMLKAKKVPIRVLKERSGYLLNTIQSAMSNMAQRLWAEGLASAEDIDLGVRTTFGFRTPHEGPLMHYDLGGFWKWPEDVRAKSAERRLSDPELSEEVKEKLWKRSLEGKPWFVDPDHFDEALELRDREYARRLKDLYWGKLE